MAPTYRSTQCHETDNHKIKFEMRMRKTTRNMLHHVESSNKRLIKLETLTAIPHFEFVKILLLFLLSFSSSLHSLLIFVFFLFIFTLFNYLYILCPSFSLLLVTTYLLFIPISVLVYFSSFVSQFICLSPFLFITFHFHSFSN